MYWCTVNRTFHRANPSTLKHSFRQFFSFPIVSYGVWDGESYKKIEYLFIFVPYLSVLKVREWIYVDVEWIYVDVDRPRFGSLTFPQTKRCNFWMVSQFSIVPNIPTVYGKLPKTLILLQNFAVEMWENFHIFFRNWDFFFKNCDK